MTAADKNERPPTFDPAAPTEHIPTFDPDALPELDDTLVRATVDELRVIAQRAHKVEIALVATAAVLMVLVAAFTGWNTYRLRHVNRNLTNLVEVVEANQAVQQTYSEGHAASTAESHDAIANNISCMANFFVDYNRAVVAGEPLPDRAVLAACFKPTVAPPPPQPLPGEKKRDGGG